MTNTILAFYHFLFVHGDDGFNHFTSAELPGQHCQQHIDLNKLAWFCNGPEVGLPCLGLWWPHYSAILGAVAVSSFSLMKSHLGFEIGIMGHTVDAPCPNFWSKSLRLGTYPAFKIMGPRWLKCLWDSLTFLCHSLLGSCYSSYGSILSDLFACCWESNLFVCPISFHTLIHLVICTSATSLCTLDISPHTLKQNILFLFCATPVVLVFCCSFPLILVTEHRHMAALGHILHFVTMGLPHICSSFFLYSWNSTAGRTAHIVTIIHRAAPRGPNAKLHQ